MARDASSAGTEPDAVSPESAATGREIHAVTKEDVSSELLATLLAVMPDAAVVVNGDGAIVALNDQAESLFGYATSELSGRPVELLVPERFRHTHRHDRGHYLKKPRARAMGVG